MEEPQIKDAYLNVKYNNLSSSNRVLTHVKEQDVPLREIHKDSQHNQQWEIRNWKLPECHRVKSDENKTAIQANFRILLVRELQI